MSRIWWDPATLFRPSPLLIHAHIAMRTHCCPNFFLAPHPWAKRSSRPNMRRSLKRFNHNFRHTRVALPQDKRGGNGFLFFGHDF